VYIDLDAEVKARVKAEKIAEKQRALEEQHYQWGWQAAWARQSIDAMPNFKLAWKASAWLRGHASASNEVAAFKARCAAKKSKPEVARAGFAALYAALGVDVSGCGFGRDNRG
jgi:hypothetical protein